MRTGAKPSAKRRIAITKQSPALPAELETVDWDTRIDFPPSQEVRTMRTRFVEVPEHQAFARFFMRVGLPVDIPPFR